VHDLLTNPAYAGAFVFGRTRTEKRVDPVTGTVHARDRVVPREQWEVLIPDHHRGFITWETYEANTARLRGNWRRPRELAGGAVREGRALLQGLLRCGRCGRIMQTAYSGTKGNCPRYVCARAKQLYAGEHVCQSIGGVRLENTVLDEIFAVLEPAALTATAQALAEADTHYRRDLAVFELATERARYEADRAQRQFDNVEPENRLVARTLESALETKLAAVRAAENNLAAQRARRPVALTEQELAWITTAGADVRAVFEAPTTTLRERKQLIRAVIDEIAVTVRAEQRVAQLRILWQGGAGTEVSMPMTKPGQHLRVTDEATVALVRRLAEHYDDRTRGDPGQTEAPHRHRPALHPGAGGDPARRPRHPGLPTIDTRCRIRLRRCRRGHHRRRTDPRRRPHHPVPLDPRRLHHRRTDHPRRTLAHPYRPAPA
jgi:hypothetical protein